MTTPAPEIDPQLRQLVEDYARQGYSIREHTRTAAVMERRPRVRDVVVAAVMAIVGGEPGPGALRPAVRIYLDDDGRARALPL